MEGDDETTTGKTMSYILREGPVSPGLKTVLDRSIGGQFGPAIY